MKREGWICPKCGTVHSPDTRSCERCATVTYPWGDMWTQWQTVPAPLPHAPARMPICGCIVGSVCMNTACPHRIDVTCSVTSEPFAGLPEKYQPTGGR